MALLPRAFVNIIQHCCGKKYFSAIVKDFYHPFYLKGCYFFLAPSKTELLWNAYSGVLDCFFKNC